jgi:CheY-like chemotaxis protein
MLTLVSEKRPPNQVALRLLLESWNYQVEIVSSASAAVEELKTRHYDLYLPDVKLPRWDGFEAVRAIRERLDYIPILAITVNSFAEIKPLLAAGIDDFIEKPFDCDELHREIIELTVKTITVVEHEDHITIFREMPMNAEHLRELRDLEKKGLCKMKLRGAIHDVDLIVHKNVPQKIFHDFIAKKQQVSVFLDRSEDKPGECYLYRPNFLLATRYLTDDTYSELSRQEDESLEKHTHLILKEEEQPYK